MHVVHITSVHPRDDIRIRVKECASLASRINQPVTLLVQDGKGPGEISSDNIKTVDIGSKSKNRILRIIIGSLRMWRALSAIKPSIVHFHDPELIPIGLALKLFGVKVIYDVHEDVPKQIQNKHWIPKILRGPVSSIFWAVEWIAVRIFDGIVAATPAIATRFPESKTITVQNFPILNELSNSNPEPMDKRPFDAAYVGVIGRHRGAIEMLQALDLVQKKYPLRLSLYGTYSPASLRNDLMTKSGWASVDDFGWVGRGTVARSLARARMGLVLFMPLPNHINSQPNKLFEYMSAGLPVIASDFPLWREIVEGAKCGLLVDPSDPVKIADAMVWILEHPQEAETMGNRGRKTVEEKYNWESEASKLVNLYNKLLPDK